PFRVRSDIDLFRWCRSQTRSTTGYGAFIPSETSAKVYFGSPGWPSPGRAKRDFRGAAGAAPALSQRGLPQIRLLQRSPSGLKRHSFTILISISWRLLFEQIEPEPAPARNKDQ